MEERLKKEYDRMNPTLPELMLKIQEYCKSDHGAPALELSRAEADLLIQTIENYFSGTVTVKDSGHFPGDEFEYDITIEDYKSIFGDYSSNE